MKFKTELEKYGPTPHYVEENSYFGKEPNSSTFNFNGKYCVGVKKNAKNRLAEGKANGNEDVEEKPEIEELKNMKIQQNENEEESVEKNRKVNLMLHILHSKFKRTPETKNLPNPYTQK